MNVTFDSCFFSFSHVCGRRVLFVFMNSCWFPEASSTPLSSQQIRGGGGGGEWSLPAQALHNFSLCIYQEPTSSIVDSDSDSDSVRVWRECSGLKGVLFHLMSVRLAIPGDVITSGSYYDITSRSPYQLLATVHSLGGLEG